MIKTALDAERTFAADAQRLGQWTAFRKWAAPNAVMFAPKPVRAHDYLRALKDPPAAIRWSPVQSIVACDGGTAVNFGFWTLPGDQHGYFVTVWQRQPDGGWRWAMDGGDVLDHGYPPRQVEVSRGACRGRPRPVFTEAAAADAQEGKGRSVDGTLAWRWTYRADGERTVEVFLWNGRNMGLALERHVAPSAAP